ncbi:MULTISPECIES: telomere-protecting terminal protein Tpg [unclassified Streptomyces]|uniref:telomere-protecting terminal protein Tpg n=1 Tax=unclassified Streptomyces TaxID=2593676 RepID=UPI002961F513|nr:XRE family transcriptional regulator [Streptomyces sp. N50]WOX15521.1 XRE family transcriptional regulator [Streptomyces sp. N50]
MGEIEDAIERAGREAFTRQPPTTLKGQISYLMKQLKTAGAVAAELGITADSVNRYRRGARKHPPRHIQERIDAAVRSRWQPLIRKRRRQKAAATDGITVETRARFGYSAPVGTTDDGRFRRLTVHLPAEYARRLFDAREQGAGDQQLRDIVAEGLQEVYFKDGGRRAAGLEVALNDIDYFDVSF